MQIAEALEAAHRDGDHPPRPETGQHQGGTDGQVKVLDFGLAKALDPARGGGSAAAAPSMSPTLTAQMTQPGMILGTAAYMSPEQARGQSVDERSDIWSFGCVLWESLTGETLFGGPQVNIVSPLLAVNPDGEPVELPEIAIFRAGERMRFLPDGTGLVYMRGFGLTQDFWLLDLTTLESRQLTQLDSTATMRTFDLTPDGTHIVFDRLTEDSDIVLIELSEPSSNRRETPQTD